MARARVSVFCALACLIAAAGACTNYLVTKGASENTDSTFIAYAGAVFIGR